VFGPLLDRGLSVAGDTRQLSFRSWGCEPHDQPPKWAVIYSLFLTPRSISVWHGWYYKQLGSCRHRNNARSRKSGRTVWMKPKRFWLVRRSYTYFFFLFTSLVVWRQTETKSKKKKKTKLHPTLFKMDCR